MINQELRDNNNQIEICQIQINAQFAGKVIFIFCKIEIESFIRLKKVGQ